MIKIVIADPHPIIYKGVKSFFRNSTEISVIGKTINFLELLNFLESKKLILFYWKWICLGLMDFKLLNH